MKTAQIWLIGALLVVTSGVGFGYNYRLASRVQTLEQRLKLVESPPKVSPPTAVSTEVDARTMALEQRLQVTEAALHNQKQPSPPPDPANRIAELERRVQRLERTLTPHFEYLGSSSNAK